MAEQEIAEIISVPSEERSRGSNEPVLEYPAKSLHEYHLMSSPVAIITCIILKATLGSDGIVVFKMGTIPLLGMAGLYVVLLLCPRYTSTDLQTYFRTVAVVVDDYALLVMINMEYIEIAITPIVILFFVGALATKVRGNQRREPTSGYSSESAELIKMARMPYLLQLFFLIWTQYRGQQDSIFIFSDFLLFFSSVVCALAVMMCSPPLGVTPGSEEVMQKTCIIMLMVTAQTMTAEWLGEDIIFVSMPVLTVVLIFLGIPFDHAGIGVSSVTSGTWSYFLISVPHFMACALPSAYPNDESISQASWLVRLFCISSSCSAISHFHVWLLHQWPGSTTNSNGPIQLLNDSLTISFHTSVVLCFATIISIVNSVDPWIFLHEATWAAGSLLLAPLIFSPERLVQHRGEHGKSARKVEPSSGVALQQQLAVQQRGEHDKSAGKVEPSLDVVLQQQLAVQHRGAHLHMYNGIGAGALPRMIDLLYCKLEYLVVNTGDYKLVPEFKEGIRKLSNYLSRIERKARVNIQVWHWVRELVYDTDDWVDLLRIDTERPIVELLENLLRRTEDVFQQHIFLEDIPSGTRSTASLDPQLAVDNSGQLVGIDGPSAKVVKMVADASSGDGPEVLCIVGMVGSGKTTLAGEVYKQIAENLKFDCCASVSVGQTLEKDKLIGHLLSELGVSDTVDAIMDRAYKARCQQFLSYRRKQHLEDKRHLLSKLDTRDAEMASASIAKGDAEMDGTYIATSDTATDRVSTARGDAGKVEKALAHMLEQYLKDERHLLSKLDTFDAETDSAYITRGDAVDVEQLLSYRKKKHLEDTRQLLPKLYNRRDAGEVGQVLSHMLERYLEEERRLFFTRGVQMDSEYTSRDVFDPLTDRLKEHLYDKRYLIMIDDYDIWSKISYYFPENNLGSWIITTRRIENVGNDGDHVIYMTLPLDDADARKLFYQRIFGGSLNCPGYLKDVSDKILRKCGGLPLALLSVGNMLANMPRTQEVFESFLKSGAFYQQGLRGQASFQVETMRQIIGHIYNDLPEDLRACLLYLSIFPDEYAIKTKRLMRLWVAEGLLGVRCTEKSAEHFIHKLVARNMIQFQSLGQNDNVNHKICVVHPVIHDFIVWQAMEENFVTIAQDGNTFDRDCTVRRLSIFDEVEDGIDLSHARSVSVFGDAKSIPPLSKLSVVRVLDLEDYKGPVCLDGLCELVLLRYLSLRGTDVSELPENIGDLRSLETLDVRSTKVKELPLSIVKLGKLACLLAGNAKLPIGIRKMEALYKLSCAVVGHSFESFLKEVGQILILRELELFCDATHMSEDEKQVVFRTRGFYLLQRMRIHSSFPSLEFGLIGVFPHVKVLELKFQSTEAPVISGIKLLREVEKVLVDKEDGPATLEAVRDAAKLRNPCPRVEQVQWEEF